MPINWDALEAETKAAEKAADDVALNEDEKRKHALLERVARAKAARADAEKARREILAGEKVASAQEATGGQYLVRAIDLASFFPFGEAPTVDRLPGGGVIIVRSPTEKAAAAWNKSVKPNKDNSAAFVDLAIASTVDPGPDDPLLRAFFDAYPLAGTNAGNIVCELGGLKIATDKS